MIGEVNFFGIYLSPLLPWAIIALTLTVFTRRLMMAIGLYRLVWHSALFDLALFILFWASIAAFSRQALGLLDPVL